MTMEIIYKLDGVDLKTYGVMVSDSKSTIGRLKMKEPNKISWPTMHGEMVDLSNKYYEAREITLECFLSADGATDFITKLNAFSAVFDKKATNRLSMLVYDNNPYDFEVYVQDSIEPTKKWNPTKMVGTFTLKLREPEPVKRMLKFIASAGAMQASITLTSAKMINTYWGDGSHTYDISGTSQTITHTFSVSGTYYILLTGDIDSISSFSSNATTIWNKF